MLTDPFTVGGRPCTQRGRLHNMVSVLRAQECVSPTKPSAHLLRCSADNTPQFFFADIPHCRSVGLLSDLVTAPVAHPRTGDYTPGWIPECCDASEHSRAGSLQMGLVAFIGTYRRYTACERRFSTLTCFLVQRLKVLIQRCVRCFMKYRAFA